MTRTSPLLLAFVLALASACGARPDIRYYQLQIDERAMARSERDSVLVFAIETMVGDSAYEDPRIVYRTSPYRLDYYHYHRWSSPPGVMLSDFLRDAYEQTGYFDAVVAGFSPNALVFLSGRLVAFEEVDVARDEWIARVKLNLFLREQSGEVVWSDTLTQEAPVHDLTPEGVAAAMSHAVTRIVADTAPQIAEYARRAHERMERRQALDSAFETIAPEAVPP